jgi:hypothetical protein
MVFILAGSGIQADSKCLLFLFLVFSIYIFIYIYIYIYIHIHIYIDIYIYPSFLVVPTGSPKLSPAGKEHILVGGDSVGRAEGY